MNRGSIERYFILFICLVLLVSTVFPLTVSADEPLTVRFGVYQNPPLVFINEDGNTSGIFIDLLEYIADKESWAIKYVPGEWADLLKQLERGEIDMIGAIAHTEARSVLFDFSTESVITNWGQIYTRVDEEIESILDLEDKTLAMLKGDIHAKAFKNLLQSFDVSTQLIEAEDYQSVFAALQRGEADAGVVNRLAAMKYLGDYDVRETSIIFNPVENCYAVTKGLHQDLITALNANLRALKADESSIYHQSLEKWFGVGHSVKSVIPRWVYFILISMGGLAFLLLGGNYFLRTQVMSKTKDLREDIVQRKRAEKALQEAHDQLEDKVAQRTKELQNTNKELDAFAYSVSHDLRAPLRAISGFTRILMEDYVEKLDAEGKRLGGIIQQNTRKMAQLIDDLLTFSRMGRTVMKFSKINMKEMATAIYHEATDVKTRKRITFSVADLPEAEGDTTMMRQVWMNLISNAVKFSTNRRKAVISISCQEKENKLVYCIKDNGAGFNMKYKDKLFGVFQRLHSEKEFEGTGVGLALVQRIIYRHGGEVRAEGEVDNGAAFYFSLPKN